MFILAEVCTEEMANILAIVRFALTVIQWVVPIILIVLGTIDLVRAVIAGKDEDIKASANTSKTFDCSSNSIFSSTFSYPYNGVIRSYRLEKLLG